VTRLPGRPSSILLAAVLLLVVASALLAGPRGPGAAATPGATAPSSSATAAPTFGTEGPTASATGPILSPAGPSTSVPSPSPDSSGELTLAGLLAKLRVATEARAGYDRSLFEHWIDADGDGCNTRYEVLIEEAVVPPLVSAGCQLTGGSWVSLYDGLSFTDLGELDIDHVVALAEAWDSGASGWSAARRRDFANDLGAWWSLVAVSAASNRSKSDQDPADWLPPAPGAGCSFIGAWLASKARWDLAVDAREERAIEDLLPTCSATRMPYLPAPASPSPTPGPTPDGGCDPAYPGVCIPPPPPDLDCGEVTSRNFVVLAPDPHRFDGDGDGVGCET